MIRAVLDPEVSGIEGRDFTEKENELIANWKKTNKVKKPPKVKATLHDNVKTQIKGY